MFAPIRSIKAILPALVFALASVSSPLSAGSGYAVYQSDAPFEDVMEGLKLAIQEQGMYINNVMHMSEMLERTGKDLGMDTPIYGHAESVEFCSATLSRAMTSEDPTRIVNCPFIISVYTLPGEDDTTYVVHKEIPADQTEGSEIMTKIAAMLKTVASAAADW